MLNTSNKAIISNVFVNLQKHCTVSNLNTLLTVCFANMEQNELEYETGVYNFNSNLLNPKIGVFDFV